MQMWVRSLGGEDPLEKEMATHSSILAWRIPWTQEPGGLQSMRSHLAIKQHTNEEVRKLLKKVFISKMYDENIFLSLSYKEFVISTIITLHWRH